MKINLFLLCALLCNNVLAQPFQIGHTTMTLIDASRNNRNIPTEIYYPTDIAGDNIPMTMANNDQFPVISFGHGFVMTWDAYQNIWEAVVAEGFIMAFPKTEAGIAPSHFEFGKDIAFVISELNALGQNNASLFYNRIDSMNCVIGHSMGGGSAFLAAQMSPVVKALATLAPAETTPSAIQAAASVNLPSLIFAGGNDCVTPPAGHQIPMYDALTSDCKTYISIQGGSHCQMANNNALCSFGELTCSPQPTISREEQHAVINRYLLPWLKYELKGDCIAGAQFDSLIVFDDSIAFQKSCSLCSASHNNEINSNFQVDVFPNPFNDYLFIQCDTFTKGMLTVDLYAMDGCRIFSKSFSNLKVYDKLKLSLPEDFPEGIYLLKVTTAGRNVSRKIIKQ